MQLVSYLAVGNLPGGGVLAEGEAIDAGALDVVSLPVTADVEGLGQRLIPDTQANRDWITGARLNRPVPSGQILSYDLFEALEGKRLDQFIAPGRRATTISVNAANSLNNRIVPGNRIDILGVMQSETSRAATGELILEDVRVLAVGDSTSISELESEGGSYSTMTIEVSAEQALTLFTKRESLAGSTFDVLLRNQCDTASPSVACR